MKISSLETKPPEIKGLPDDPRKRAKYLAIIEAALEAFSEYGYHDCPVSKIARKANVADGTIYLYFANKEEVLISVFQEKINRLIDDIEELMPTCANAWDKIEVLVRYHITTLGNNPILANFLQIQLRQSSVKIRQDIAGPLRKLYYLIEGFVAEGQKAGVIDSAINVAIARKVIFGSIDEVVSCWVLSRRRYDVTAMIDDILYILRRALLVKAAAEE
ncbi:MAG: TetR/AcrR family transcriptional regulator [Deltaproteobacteria bacterium]|nr:TetR/AcrR family transcriptional regulator [Deltaproteobacteria bacterium]